ncbi:Creatinine amidohydrolase [Planctomycetes bacterium Poly30]|uniref:Creatinine amidohydrolase n=1 Tax=Saltatorellus ferox TaxID=2528018 RepID=A0A518EYB6_9BACT|nr:Creatinine amidohydrolase [Planctomycetes bacterium Poly30]
MISWTDLRTDEFADLDPEATVAILPVAAVEQHGPHLPVGTDAMILEGVLERVEVDPALVRGLVLPLQHIGHSPEHTGFAGTLHQEPETLLQHWTEIGRAVHRSGVRKLVILNSHGGQPQIIDLVGQRLRRECSMLVVRASTFAFGMPDRLFDAEEVRYGMHGGEVETSMMLALRPDLVRMDAAIDFVSAASEMAESFDLLGAEEPIGMAWAAQDLHVFGATGNARLADADRGDRLLEFLASELATLLMDVRDFSLKRLRDAPL